MSRPSHRFTLIHQAIVATTISLTTLTTQAANLGQANIQSAQHEPLSATIDVSDIDAQNFSANLASSGVYQQMGLAQNPTINVRFTPTSATTGKITLTSTAPISTPFADVVLTLNDNGNHSVEPQTLLMPMSSNSNIPASLITPVMIAADHEQNLPVAGGVIESDPLSIDLASGEPLETMSEDTFDNTMADMADDVNPVVIGSPSQHNDNINISTDSIDILSGLDSSDILATDSLEDGNQNNTSPMATESTMPDPVPVANRLQSGQTISEESRVLSAITPEGTNTQLNILTEQITRRIISPNTSIVPEMATNHTQTQEQPTAQTTKTQQPKTTPEAQSNSSEAVYVVQSGDNLWSIASEIAKANDVSISDVMKEIHQQNPDAFFNNDIGRLKTQATLNLPNYNVVPSQRAIQEAINVQKHARSTSNGTNQRVSRSHTNNHNANATQSNRSHHRSNRNNGSKQQNRTQKPLPKAQLTLVSPSSGGQVTGAQTRTGNTSKAANGNAKLVSTLRNTRNQTVANANRVNSLNQEFSAAKQRLQLQNQKLAELEARLKALREKK